MTDKHAAEVLVELLKKNVLSDEEREAVRAAVGVLGWTQLADARLKRMRERKEKKQNGLA